MKSLVILMDILDILLQSTIKTVCSASTWSKKSFDLTSTILAEGKSTRKQEAKQAAAKSLLDVLAERKIANEFYYDNESAKESRRQFKTAAGFNETTSMTNNINIGNFVGCLQEFCAINKFDLPKYEIVQEFSVNNVMQFTFSCTLLNIDTIGTAGSKKAAKQRAAEEMWKAVLQTEFN